MQSNVVINQFSLTEYKTTKMPKHFMKRVCVTKVILVTFSNTYTPKTSLLQWLADVAQQGFLLLASLDTSLMFGISISGAAGIALRSRQLCRTRVSLVLQSCPPV